MSLMRRMLGGLILGAWLVPAVAAAAQIFEDIPSPVLALDPSVRSAGMGGAATAVFWDIGPDDWANPALLGTTVGIRSEQGSEQLFDGVDFRSRRTTFGGAGIGVVTSGQPFDASGQVELDLDLGGSPFSTTERIRSWGIGVSLAQLTRSVSQWLGRKSPAVTEYLDLAIGYAGKQVTDQVGGLEFRQDAHDWGYLIRAGVPVRYGRWGPGRIELAYGHGALNAGALASRRGSDPADQRDGVALHTTLDAEGPWARRLPPWFARGLKPLLSIGGGFDASSQGAGDHHGGGELVLANVAFVRLGTSRVGPDDETLGSWGFGVGLPLGEFGGFRYDRAYVRQLGGDTGTPQSWTVWLNPVAIVRELR